MGYVENLYLDLATFSFSPGDHGNPLPVTCYVYSSIPWYSSTRYRCMVYSTGSPIALLEFVAMMHGRQNCFAIAFTPTINQGLARFVFSRDLATHRFSWPSKLLDLGCELCRFACWCASCTHNPFTTTVVRSRQVRAVQPLHHLVFSAVTQTGLLADDNRNAVHDCFYVAT